MEHPVHSMFMFVSTCRQFEATVQINDCNEFLKSLEVRNVSSYDPDGESATDDEFSSLSET